MNRKNLGQEEQDLNP